MADLISRAEAIAEIEEYIEEYSELEPETGYHNLKWCAMEEAKDVLSMLPTVDAVPVVHARWRELKDGTEECTNCLGLCPHEENYNGDVIFNFGCEYCPWCGAKMDGERRDEDAAD